MFGFETLRLLTFSVLCLLRFLLFIHENVIVCNIKDLIHRGSASLDFLPENLFAVMMQRRLFLLCFDFDDFLKIISSFKLLLLKPKYRHNLP